MLKRLGQLAALAALVALLVYAPEIFRALSAPYRVGTQPRVLLRVALCCKDEEVASAVYRALDGFRGEREALHLRVTRVDAARARDMSIPPDVYLLPASALDEPQRWLLPLEVLEEGAPDSPGVTDGVRYAVPCADGRGAPLYCAAGAYTANAEIARALAARLSQPDAQEGR